MIPSLPEIAWHFDVNPLFVTLAVAGVLTAFVLLALVRRQGFVVIQLFRRNGS